MNNLFLRFRALPLLALAVLSRAGSGGACAQTPLLDAYVQAGLTNSLTLKQQSFVLQKNLYALQEAKALFMPSVNGNLLYTTAQGGRSISIPVGDLVNPVYSTLNQLTQSNRFPQISNVSEQFFPQNFYDMRVKTTMPLLNAEIKYNQLIKKEQTSLQMIEIQLYKRELVKDIKVAYFNFLKAQEAVRIYENALTLVHESERVNKSLIENGTANPTVLVRTRNEIARIQSEKEATQNTLLNAKAYFNFLINQDLETAVQADSAYAKYLAPQPTVEAGKREELDKLQTVLSVNQYLLKLSQSYKQPKIGASLDLGSQGFLKDINTKNLFALFGLSIDLPIYQAGRNKLKIKQVESDIQALEAQTEQVKQQLDLQATVALNSHRAAQQIYRSKQGQVETSQRYYRDILRRYKEGQANFIELLDAQTQITTAQLQQVIALYDVWLRWAELERATAAYRLN